MELVNDFQGRLKFDKKTYVPYADVHVKINVKAIKDAQNGRILSNDDIAKLLGKKLLKEILEIDEDTMFVPEGEQVIKEASAPTPAPAVVKEVPNVAKFSMITKIARQVEGEYVFVDVVKAHKDTDKLRQYLQQNELPRTEIMGDVPCVVEYGVLEDVVVDVD